MQDMDFSFDLSQTDSSCFIVNDSQENDSQFSERGPKEMLASMKALQIPSLKNCKNLPFSPRKCDMASSQKTSGRKTAGNNSQNDPSTPTNSQGNSQPAGGQGAGGNGGQSGGNGGGDDHNPGNGAGAGGGGNGGNGGGGEEEEEEEAVQDETNPGEEDQTPSTGSTTTSGSIPPLLQIPAATSPAVAIPEHVVEETGHDIHVAEQGENPTAQTGQAGGSGQVAQGQLAQGQGEGESSSLGSVGGISDAPTAVVSDSDHRFSAPEGVSSPGRASLSSTRSPRGGAVVVAAAVTQQQELSSAVSTMSSFSSTSSDEPKPPARRKAPFRKLQMPPAKKPKLDISTSTTSPETSTSSSNRKTTTTTTTSTSEDTSMDRGHDTSADTSGGRDRSHDTQHDHSPPGAGHDVGGGGNISGSQRDMFDDQGHEELQENEPDDQVQVSQSQYGLELEDDEVSFATPAEKLGSLQFSGECFVAETVDDEDSDGNSDIVPPSQNAFDSIPRIVPSSPSSLPHGVMLNKDGAKVSESVEKPRAGSSSSKTSIPEWQPSFRSFESYNNNGRSATSSRQTSVDSSSSNTEKRHRNDVKGESLEPKRVHSSPDLLKQATEPMQTQDLELSRIVASEHSVCQNTTSETDELRLHLTEYETCHGEDDSTISVNVSSLMVLEKESEEPVVHKVDSSSSEEKHSTQQHLKDESGTSPGLALRLSQTLSEAPHLSASQFEDANEDGSHALKLADSTAVSLKPSQNIEKPSATPFSIKTSMKGLLQQKGTIDTPAQATTAERISNPKSPRLEEQREKDVAPSLTLDMISTMTEEDTEAAATGFKLDRPTSVIAPDSVPEKEQTASLFALVRQGKASPIKQRDSVATNTSTDMMQRRGKRDPCSESSEAQRRSTSPGSPHRKTNPRKSPKQSSKKSPKKSPRKSPGKGQKKTDSDVMIIDTEDRVPQFPTSSASVSRASSIAKAKKIIFPAQKENPIDTADNQEVIRIDDDPTESAIPNRIVPSYDSATQDYSYGDKAESEHLNYSDFVQGRSEKVISQGKPSSGARYEKSTTNTKTRSSQQASVSSLLTSKTLGKTASLKGSETAAGPRTAAKDSNKPTDKEMPNKQATKSKKEVTHATKPSSSRATPMEAHEDTPKSTKKKRVLKSHGKLLHYTREVPRRGHVLSPRSASRAAASTSSSSEAEHVSHLTKPHKVHEGRGVAGHDPYEYHSSQSQHDREEREAVLQSLTTSARVKHNAPNEEELRLMAATMDTLPIVEELAEGGVVRPHTQPIKTSSRQSDVITPQQAVVAKPGPSGNAVARPDVSFMTVRMCTKYEHTVTLLQKIVNGVVVNISTVGDKFEKVGQSIAHDIDVVGTPSPNRSGQTMTTGDLGDISSISSSNFPSRPNSNHNSPAFLSRTHSKEVSVSKSSSSLSSGVTVSKHLVAVQSTTVQAAAHTPNMQAETTVIEAENSSKTHVFEHQSPSIPLAQAAKSNTASVSASTSKSSEQQFGSAFSLNQVSKSALVVTNKSSTSTDKHSESLFTESSAQEAVGIGASVSRLQNKSSSSTHHSESLFSRTSSSVEQRVHAEFVHPSETNIPIASNKRRSSSSKSTTASSEALEKSSETDVIPPSEPDTSHIRQMPMPQVMLSPATSVTRAGSGGGSVKKRKKAGSEHGEGKKQDDVKGAEKVTTSDEAVSPEIPVQGAIAAESGKNSSSDVSRDDVESFPPYWPTTETLVKDTPVLAMWRDKHWYHGRVLSAEKNKYSVAFEDGGVRNVKASEVIVCDLLAQGQKCLAEREDHDGWQEEATVIGHHKKGDARACVVRFADGTTARVERGQLSLTKVQVNNLVTGVVTEALAQQEANSKTTASVSNMGAREAETGTEMTAIKPKETEPIEEYEATPAYLPASTTLSCTAALPVYAKWLDKHYYPGFVVEQDKKSGKCLVEFEDGTKRKVPCDDLIICDLLGTSQQVYADDGDAGFLLAEVVGHWRRGQTIGYMVKFCDGPKTRLERGKVILREEQAVTLLDTLRPFGTPKPSAADVSLDHLVEGKRSRPGKSVLSPAPRGSSARTKAKSDESGQEGRLSTQKSVESSGISSTGGKRTSKRKLEPKYTSTPTPKRRAGPSARETAASNAGATTPRAPEGMVNSPQQARRSPRKAKLELFSVIKGPMPPIGCNIFKGICFLLTHVEKTQAQTRREKEILRKNDSMDVSTTDESFMEDEITVPFDKEHLTHQIELGGGVVLLHYNADVIAQYQLCVLVSSTHQRTLKYIYGLAAGLPCVSHVWIKDCCNTGKLSDYKSYLLPAGISLETNTIRECWTKRNPLRSLCLVVSSRDHGFVDTWVSILHTCGCQIPKALPDRLSQNTVYAVVADKNIEEEMLTSASKLNIPVVSSEWVIQCLINAQVVDCTTHPRYKHTFELNS